MNKHILSIVIGVNKRSFIDNGKEERNSEFQRIEKHTEIFASMCPDEILDYYNDYNTREYSTTLMLGDISGFTELAEKYTTSGASGPSKLTETLNNYIGPMVQEILSHHGDVLKFSGDAFMVMWKLQNGMVMRDLTTKAMRTACIIQKYFGTYETDIGVTLRVKIAIASGKTYFTSIGDPQWMSHYIITGKPMWDAKFAEALCRGGDILVTPSSWQWANPKDYVFKILPDNRHTLIVADSTMWESSKIKYGDKESIADYSINSSSLNLPSTEAHPVGVDKIVPNSDNQIRYNRFQSVDYSLRPKVTNVVEKQLKNELRSYMVGPVIHSVDLNEPLENLAEIRQVVIVFINVITDNIGRKKLILLVNKTFKLICRIVSELQGCVNKMSLFDKDLMFLCIFGFKGGKQDLEAQIALRCASRLKSVLSIIKNIHSVTIAISTGMAYCGVVGHILRREYTVIGMPVNKAARLMIAYQNKVVCDRESFLHSRLEAGHFILQEVKYLKGISNVGPIYEFIEEAKTQNSEHKKLFPILNRKTEIQIFKRILNEAQYYWQKNKETPLKNMNNLLIIRGEPRIGKTRLLDEMAKIVPKDIACNYITLTFNDYQTPYKLINLIFCVPLRLNASSTPKNRQNILLNYLKPINHPENLCVLNQVFDVNFKTNSHFLILSKKLTRNLLHELIAQLLIKCFNKLWIILIDDAENIDHESLNLIPTIVNQHRILFILSLIDDGKEIYPTLQEKAEIIKIDGLDKWYHVSLACQFLKVDAISLELEKVIQERSHGNPGWIESFLISLLQIGGIEILKIPREQLNRTDLVHPSLLMILSDQSEESDKNFKKTSKKNDEWKMYEFSYEPDLSLFHGKKEISICTIVPQFEIEDANTELTIDVTFLKMFDSLKPLDQILLKCASVLGETIDRSLLEKLMDKTSIRDIALSIKKLFEMRIIGCASDNLDHNYSQITLLKNVQNVNNKNIKIICECVIDNVKESLVDLPKYASCQNLQFKFTKFRTATYRLLTEHQKTEFHKKALRFLQYNTKKCEPCGKGFFTNLIKRPYQDNPKSSRRLESSDDLTEAWNSVVFHKDPHLEGKLKEKNNRKLFDHIMRRSESKLIPKTYSDVNFINCQCNSILITTYTQILNHCRGLDRKDKALIAILEFVEILLATSNVPQAKKLLDTAEEILINAYKLKDDKLITVPCLKGKIKTFQARCNLQLGLTNTAVETIKDAIKVMGYKIPTNKIAIRLKIKLLFQRQRLLLLRSKKFSVKINDGEVAEYYCQLSKSLSQIFKIYQIKGMQEHAQLAAIWSLNVALIGNHDFITLCNAFANMITMSHKFKNQAMIKLLINDGIKICYEKQDDLRELELRAILRLYLSIFDFYWKQNNIKEASSIGFLSFEIAKNIGLIQYQFEILPQLILLLTTKCRYNEIISLLKQLERISFINTNKSHHMLFYILCLNFQMDTGIILFTIDKCEKYYQEEGNMIVKAKDYEIKNRFLVLMWLWYLRTENWEASKIWKMKRINIPMSGQKFTDIMTITIIEKLEGLLLYYVHKLNTRNYKTANQTFHEIEKQFKIVEKMIKITKIILPRYLLMKAYFYMINSRPRLSWKLIQQTKKYALETENQFMHQWATHCEKAWIDYYNITSMHKPKEKYRLTLFKDEFNKIDEELATFYTLPLPKLNQLNQ